MPAIVDWFVSLDAMIFHFLIIFAGLVVLHKAGDYIVFSLSDYAKKIGVSDFVIGFVIVAIATAVPEFVAAYSASTLGKGAMVFGTIMGSNLFKIPLLGIVFLIAKKITITHGVGGNAPLTTLLITMLPLGLVIDGTLTQIDGIILVAAFLIYIAKLWHASNGLGKLIPNVEWKRVAKDTIIFVISFTAALLAARWLVASTDAIASNLNITPYLVGLLVIGIGSSVPELSILFSSIKKHHHHIAFGNIVGSMVANAALVLGIVAILNPVTIAFKTLLISTIFLAVGMFTLLYFVHKKKVTWKHGLILIGIYVLFLAVEFIFG